MGELWRVDVSGVSHRFVEAASREEAAQAVRDAVIKELDIRAEPASGTLRQVYRGLPQQRRRRLIEAMDGLAPPRTFRTAKSARRRLAREWRQHLAEKAWIAANMGPARPAAPEHVDMLLRQMETDRLLLLRRQLRGVDKALFDDGL
jgi:hypothetical protein